LSTQADIAVTYDVSNSFFSLWLDRWMIYSCALFEGTDDLDQAQVNKLTWFFEKARVTPEKRVLDIGCGWGGLMDFFALEKGAKDLTGITLSQAQYNWVKEKGTPGVKVEFGSYLNYQPQEKFDAVVSIGMFEHIATPEQVRGGENLRIYRDYFRRVWEWTTPGTWFGLQSVIGALLPRKREEIRDLGWGTSTIFPGAVTPRPEVILSAVNPYWEVMELWTRREHYARTSAAWLEGLRKNESVIRERWGDQTFEDYERYLGGCVRVFEKGYQSLAQLVLRRID